MALRERTLSVLVVSSSEKFASSIVALLKTPDYGPVTCVKTASEARRLQLERPYDLVLINAPLKDENGYNLAIDLSAGSSEILIFVRSDIYDAVLHKVNEHGVLVLSKPVTPQMITQTLGIMSSTHYRLKKMLDKQSSVEEKIQEIRLVNRAKWLLIECLNINESEAHKFIEKKAMDDRVTRREVAERIIKTYG